MSLQLSAGFLAVLFSQMPAPIDGKGFSPAVQKDAILATVRVINRQKNTWGVGVLLESGHVLTAAHVVDGTPTVDVHVFSAESYPNNPRIYKSVLILASGKDRQPDLALVDVGVVKGGLKICPLKKVPPKDKRFAAMAAGCGDSLAPTLRLMTVQDDVQAKKPNEARVGGYFRTAEKSIKGQSGGPLINTEGQLLGICSGTSGERGMFCDLSEIHDFLGDNGLKKLLKTP